jgi:hypothetical protein
MASTRRLAAILAADVAGCSRPMGADQEATLKPAFTCQGKRVDTKQIGGELCVRYVLV